MLVAVLGTGIMGAPMARRIREAGHDVRAWNRTIDRARPLAEHGVEVAESAGEAVAGADVVVTMLADRDAVLATLDGQGALEAMDGDAVLCQTSTIGIAGIGEVAERCERRGVALVDAPVLGTRQPAEQGQLVVLAAGPDGAVARCEPVFEAIGQRTVRLGEAGEATRLKLVLNHWLLGLVESLAETIQLAEGLGVDPRTFLDTIDGGPLGPPYARLKGDAMIERAFSPPGFPLDLALKDARLVLEGAQREGLELGLVEVVRERMERASRDGHGREDMAAVFLAD